MLSSILRHSLRTFGQSGQVNSAPIRSFWSSTPARAGAIVQHRDTPENNENTPFSFNEDSNKKIEQVLSKYPSHYKQSAIMPLLDIAQRQNNNFLTLNAMNEVAKKLGVPPMRVYEVATFYSMYNRTPVGKFHLQVCGTTPCQLRGSEEIIETIKQHAGVQMGETSADGMFTLTEVECLGACVNAPMMQVNNTEFYEDLTRENVIELLDNMKAGKPLKVGPQNHRKTCEGPDGKTTLFSKPPGPFVSEKSKLNRPADAPNQSS